MSVVLNKRLDIEQCGVTGKIVLNYSKLWCLTSINSPHWLHLFRRIIFFCIKLPIKYFVQGRSFNTSPHFSQIIVRTRIMFCDHCAQNNFLEGRNFRDWLIIVIVNQNHLKTRKHCSRMRNDGCIGLHLGGMGYNPRISFPLWTPYCPKYPTPRYPTPR